MSDPPRLLDTPDAGLGSLLLRSARHDRPRPGALDRALAGAALIGTTSVATASVAAGLGKSLTPWLFTGLLSGVAASISVHAVMPLLAPDTSRGAPSEGRQPQRARATGSGEASGPIREGERLPSAPVLPELSDTAPNAAVGAPARAEWVNRVVASAGALAEIAPPRNRETAAPLAPSVAAFAIGSPAPHESGPFAAELVLIDAARRNLSEGRAAPALATLARHAREFPDGHFRPEALVLEIEAQALGGDAAAARRLALRFLQTYPAHPLGKHVRGLAAMP
jgi:hypothetical protein